MPKLICNKCRKVEETISFLEDSKFLEYEPATDTPFHSEEKLWKLLQLLKSFRFLKKLSEWKETTDKIIMKEEMLGDALYFHYLNVATSIDSSTNYSLSAKSLKTECLLVKTVKALVFLKHSIFNYESLNKTKLFEYKDVLLSSNKVKWLKIHFFDINNQVLTGITRKLVSDLDFLSGVFEKKEWCSKANTKFRFFYRSVKYCPEFFIDTLGITKLKDFFEVVLETAKILSNKMEEKKNLNDIKLLFWVLKLCFVFFGTFSVEVATEELCLVFQIAFKLLIIFGCKLSATSVFDCHNCTFLLSSDKKSLMNSIFIKEEKNFEFEGIKTLKFFLKIEKILKKLFCRIFSSKFLSSSIRNCNISKSKKLSSIMEKEAFGEDSKNILKEILNMFEKNKFIELVRFDLKNRVCSEKAFYLCRIFLANYNWACELFEKKI